MSSPSHPHPGASIAVHYSSTPTGKFNASQSAIQVLEYFPVVPPPWPCSVHGIHLPENVPSSRSNPPSFWLLNSWKNTVHGRLPKPEGQLQKDKTVGDSSSQKSASTFVSCHIAPMMRNITETAMHIHVKVQKELAFHRACMKGPSTS